MKTNKWTIADIPDLTGKVIIVTGGNSGLGYESVKAFVEKGATVIMASRSIEKAELAKKDMVIHSPEAKIHVMQLNLSDLNSVRLFVQEFKTQFNKLDILLNNAGIMMTPYGFTKDGFESQFGTNHLGHFALTGLLLDLILKTPQSRIVNVSSLAHKRGKIHFDDLLFNDGNSYDPMESYRQSKFANLLFTYELQRRLESAGSKTITVAAHPGVSITNLGNHLKGKLMYKIFMLFSGFLTHIPAQGALPQLRAAVDPMVQGGQYYGPDRMGEMKGDPVIVQSTKESHNLNDARKLWEVSEKLTGVHFEF